jgi:serine/threonine protein kinase
MERTPTFQVQSFGNYFLLERIAVGGMAEIFKAKQVGVRGFEKILVIKKILHHLSEDPEFVEMFEDEAKLAAQLNQANIVQIYELGEIDDTLYITMECIDGKNLRDVTRAAAGRSMHLGIDQCIHMITEALKGLDYAHRKTDSQGAPLNIVHRDISPQNIIISYEGEVKLLDFGIAKAASKISKTEAGVLKGKFSYMSPEQASGKPIDQTSDIYAIGVILHELLTSDRLFRSKSDVETLEKVKAGIVAPPSEKNPLVPEALDQIALKALSKDRASRYQTAGEMLQDLQRLSFDQQFNMSSQELSAFMKTLFADSIRDEKMRLQESLKRIPAKPQQGIQNARTHITFKRDQLDAAITAKPASNDDAEITTTKDRAIGASAFSTSQRLTVFSLIIAIIGGLLIWQNYFKTAPDNETNPQQEDAQAKRPEPTSIVPIPVPPPLDEKKVESILKAPGEMPTEGPLAKPSLEEEKSVPIDKPEEPAPNLNLPIPRPVSSEANKKEKTGKSNRPTASDTRKKEPAKLNVTAPPEGFAQLYINGESFGSVPGPRARNISVPSGKVSIRCETREKVYSGNVRLKANETKTVRCQDLKS